MIGAIIGDIVGSPYEQVLLNGVDSVDFQPLFSPNLSKFTDDTVLTIATADAIMSGVPFHKKYKEWARKYPNKGYGSRFHEWFNNEEDVINDSYSNGCMMRVSPIPMYCFQKNIPMDYIFPGGKSLFNEVKESIKYTHNSEEAEDGTIAVASAIYASLKGFKKDSIKEEISSFYGYPLSDSLEQVRNEWPKDTIRCKVTCPQALISFFESTDFDSAIRNAVYSKGDVDTIAAIAGSIAESYYGVDSIPKYMIAEAKDRLPQEMINVVNKFYNTIEVNFKL